MPRRRPSRRRPSRPRRPGRPPPRPPPSRPPPSPPRPSRSARPCGRRRGRCGGPRRSRGRPMCRRHR
ncbi:MAG: hypothetical protein FJX20_07735 [Alphaproteobacteria bacterium]|nr:hypothetical protein [Alphaproteobacteria bacterium]